MKWPDPDKGKENFSGQTRQMRDNLQKIVSRRKALKIRLLAVLLGLVIVASGTEAGEESQTRRSTAATTRLFSYTGKRFGVPIL